MNRKEWRKQRAREQRAYKAWKETDVALEDVFDLWLKEGGMNRKEVEQLCISLRNDFVEAISYHKMPTGLSRPADVRSGSSATEAVDATSRCMSASLRKRPKCCVAAN
jgi:hypothetical protein